MELEQGTSERRELGECARTRERVKSSSSREERMADMSLRWRVSVVPLPWNSVR